MNYNIYKALVDDEVLGDFNRRALLCKNISSLEDDVNARVTADWYKNFFSKKLKLLILDSEARHRFNLNMMSRPGRSTYRY